MGLFLLGIPLAIMGAKMIYNDARQSFDGIVVPDAPYSTQEQKKEIDKAFKSILRYCGASCDIQRTYNNQYNYIDDRNNKILINNLTEKEYGEMEQYLFSKGYNKESIEYCKSKFDNLAKQEQKQFLDIAEQRIKKYEDALKTHPCQTIRIKNKVHYPFYETEINNDCKRIEQYLNDKGHNTQCNIIIGGDIPNINHTEIWLIKQPKGYNASQYYLDICRKLNIKR